MSKGSKNKISLPAISIIKGKLRKVLPYARKRIYAGAGKRYDRSDPFPESNAKSGEG